MRGATGKLDVAPLRSAVTKLVAAADAYEKAIARLDRIDKQAERARSEIGALNETLYRTERAFRHDAGLPKREWFKHLVYAPGLYTGYGVKTLPGIREGAEQNHWDEARSFVPIVTDAVNAFTADVTRATGLLKKLTH
jgi:N-acetylated-alpha-linked acidic dipeptidase